MIKFFMTVFRLTFKFNFWIMESFLVHASLTNNFVNIKLFTTISILWICLTFWYRALRRTQSCYFTRIIRHSNGEKSAEAQWLAAHQQQLFNASFTSSVSTTSACHAGSIHSNVYRGGKRIKWSLILLTPRSVFVIGCSNVWTVLNVVPRGRTESRTGSV